MNYYKNLLSSKKIIMRYTRIQRFEKEQRLLFIGRDVSNLYTTDGSGRFHRIALYIQQVLRAKKLSDIFHLIVFMEDVYEQFPGGQ